MGQLSHTLPKCWFLITQSNWTEQRREVGLHLLYWSVPVWWESADKDYDWGGSVGLTWKTGVAAAVHSFKIEWCLPQQKTQRKWLTFKISHKWPCSVASVLLTKFSELPLWIRTWNRSKTCIYALLYFKSPPCCSSYVIAVEQRDSLWVGWHCEFVCNPLHVMFLSEKKCNKTCCCLGAVATDF